MQADIKALGVKNNYCLNTGAEANKTDPFTNLKQVISLPATDDVTVPTLRKEDARHPSSMLSERHHSAET